MALTIRQGTRKFSGIRREQTAEVSLRQKFTADKQMSYRVIPASTTFLASSGQIKGSLGDFSGSFGSSVVDPLRVKIAGTRLNDGVRLVTAITVGTAAEFLTVAQGVKAEGPLASIELRTP